MNWLDALVKLRTSRTPAVLVTLSDVRGHAPRAAGAKMVVTADQTWDSIGGGNLEEEAIRRARALLEDGGTTPVTIGSHLSDKAPLQHGVQCCGGEVAILLEPIPVRPAVAIFGVGHVGLELARILARHEVELHLIDSRSAQLAPETLAPLADAIAEVHVHQVPVLPELVIAELPPGTRVLIMTHDHAEDAALCDAVLRADHLGPIGLIGSSAKWTRFVAKLSAEGHSEAAIAQITTPIGDPAITGKQPALIALAVAAEILGSREVVRPA